MHILLTIFFNVAITFAYIELGYCVCAHAEYEINGQCCPMCAPGMEKHFEEFTIIKENPFSFYSRKYCLELQNVLT